MKSEKSLQLWRLGPRNWFRAIWAQMRYQAISWEPWLQFSQTSPYFFQNPLNHEISKNFMTLGSGA